MEKLSRPSLRDKLKPHSLVTTSMLLISTLTWQPEVRAELPVGSFHAALRAGHSKLCMGDNAGSLLTLLTGVSVLQTDCKRAETQKINLKPVSGKVNVYNLVVGNSNKCFGVDLGLLGLFGKVDGANIKHQTCSTATHQQFKAIDLGNGSINLVSVYSGKYVEVSLSSTWSGANVQQWSANGQNNQKWLLEFTSPTALKGISVPSVPGLLSADSSRSDIVTPVVVNKSAAIALGKALFWDQAIGSDGMACASCHFHAGADFRVKNQVNPGFNHNNFTFESTASGAPRSGPNYTLKQADFPFNPNSDDVASSAGVFKRTFNATNSSDINDDCTSNPDAIFNVGGTSTRQVEPRNTPTTINAGYNFRNFWDGRANNVFNGVSPFGLRDKSAGVFINNNGITKKPLNLKNSSLASQAVGPVLSILEMSCNQRQFADVGRKVLPHRPLANQSIHSQDSALSSLGTLIGSNGTYADLVKKAFNSAYWNGSCATCGSPANGGAPYSQMEANFPMIFGLAVQLYEATLVSDDSKFDKWKQSSTSLTAQEQQGHDVFNSKGKCSSCHNGPVLTSAANLSNNNQLVERMKMKNGGIALYDTGFYNLGVVPTSYDIGVGGVDPWNNPLSFSKQYQTGKFVDNFNIDSCRFLEKYWPSCSSTSSLSTEKVAVNGSFKVPTLRNIALTGPYFHNGSAATLEQVVDFYDRGGNFDNTEKHPDITSLGLSSSEKAALVAFLKTLTDDRVAYEKAPFDHPSLIVPNGHTGNDWSVVAGNSIDPALARDESVTLPAVGASGVSTKLKAFHEILP